MGWKEIPNDIVKTWDGKPLKHRRRDADGEELFEPFRCPGKNCDTVAFERMDAYRDHWNQTHAGQDEKAVGLQYRIDSSHVSDVVDGLLAAINSRDPQNPLKAIQKTNDAEHASEVWRRCQLALDRLNAPIRLRDAQYEWLHQLLDRRVPLSKEERENGAEQQTVGAYLWGLSIYNIRQALTIISERKKTEPDEEVPAPSLAAGA